MAQIITFSVSEDGKISPSTVQKAGVQGSHDVTELWFEVSGLANYYADGKAKTRIQFIDGAGGFYSTGFLTVGSDKIVKCLVPSTVTNAGGIAKVYLVVTKIVYGVEDGLAYEDQVFISSAARISFEGSGVGSPSEYQYRKGISSALVNAEIFVGQAENASGVAKEYRDSAETFRNEAGNYQSKAGMHASNAETSAGNAKTYATNAETSAGNAKTYAKDAADSLQELKDGIANGDFKGEPGETPSLDGVIQIWQPNTEYKVGDVCYYDSLPYETGINRSVFLVCKTNHPSQQDPLLDFDKWTVIELYANRSIHDCVGKVIHETYATKEELAEAIGQALEGDY